MHISKLFLSDFLSYKKLDAEFSAGLNVVSGANTAGKTNLIDAAYLASVGKSSKGLKDKDLLRRGAESARVTVRVQKRHSSHSIDIYIDRQGKKRILIDGISILKMGELLGVLNVVFFSPDEMALINNPPEDRRRFLDISLSQQNKTYFYTLVRYNALLTQRNRLLKDFKFSKDAPAVIEIVTSKLADAGVYLIAERRRFAESLALLAQETHALLTGGKERLDIVYETDAEDAGNAAERLMALYRENLQKDLRLEYTSVGAHRDDLKITADGVDLRRYGSQGQKRTAVLSVKLAEAELFKRRTGEYPVLILDDVLSELDESRRAALLAAASGMQAFITCTEYNEANTAPEKRFLVSENKENGSTVAEI